MADPARGDAFNSLQRLSPRHVRQGALREDGSFGQPWVHPHLRGKATRYHDCIEACVVCLVACEMCADACLSEQDVKMMTACIRLDRDCADVCVAAIRAMSRGGPLAAELCRACATACNACAEECERQSGQMDHCRLCAEACRRSADECRKMAA